MEPLVRRCYGCIKCSTNTSFGSPTPVASLLPLLLSYFALYSPLLRPEKSWSDGTKPVNELLSAQATCLNCLADISEITSPSPLPAPPLQHLLHRIAAVSYTITRTFTVPGMSTESCYHILSTDFLSRKTALALGRKTGEKCPTVWA